MSRSSLLSNAVTALLLASASFATAGCGCDCRDPGFYIRIPENRVPDVRRVTATGPACDDTPPECTDVDAGSCRFYRVRGSGPGACRVEVEFTSGAPTEGADVTFAHNFLCCSGLAPAGSWDLFVSGGVDAGTEDASNEDASTED